MYHSIDRCANRGYVIFRIFRKCLQESEMNLELEPGVECKYTQNADSDICSHQP
jgi:hypothetical protein